MDIFPTDWDSLMHGIFLMESGTMSAQITPNSHQYKTITRQDTRSTLSHGNLFYPLL